MFTVIAQWGHAQSGSFGSTFAHSEAETAIYEQHNFVTGSGTINAGIIGSERQPIIGLYSFVNPNGSWISASQTAFVDGYVRTYNPGAFTFPIGDNDKYRPAAVSASSSAAPTTAAYFGVDPGMAMTSNLMGGNYGILPGGGPAFQTTSKATGVGTVDNIEYWDIDGNTPARITLTWDASTPISTMVGTNLSNLTIVGWDGTKWVAIPSTFDASSLVQNTSASSFTGPASVVSAGSITTNAPVVPSSFIVYTLAGICPNVLITPSVTSLSICSGAEAVITYTTTPTGQQVLWNRMPGNLNGIGNISDYPTATGTTPESYTYTASTAAIVGCPINSTATVVTVNPIPVITPSVCSQTICSGQTGAITFTSSVSATINWLRVEDGATGTGNISQLFATAGTNTYKIWGVSAAPASCPSSTTITCVVVVNNCCSLTLTASASSTAVCTGQAINLTSSVSGNVGTVTYAWSGPNGFTSNAANPTIPSATSATAGTYFLTVSDPTSGTTCSRTASVNITVGSLYVAASSNSPVCTTGTLSLSSLSAGGSGTFTYAWTGPNGFVSAVQNPTVALSTTAQSGSYTVVITDAGGCSGTATTYVAVGVQPNLTISGAPSLTVCSGVATTLNVTGDSGATVTWTNSIGQSGTGTAINFTGIRNLSSQPQSVTFVVTAMSAACTDQELVVVTVNPEPVLQVTPNAAVYCNLEQITVSATALPNTAAINWTRTPNTPNPPVPGGSGTGSVTVQQTLPVGAYTYQFTAVGTNGCSSQTASVPVTVQQ
ncbi:immunoglobulin domain-containing protein [Larkinella sp.]|uniref:immunoglobulin domain-containing protein n=1 Tax=Larkinella sp. TaxID=2034517 RepID=UPI003BAACEF1